MGERRILNTKIFRLHMMDYKKANDSFNSLQPDKKEE